MRMRVTRQERKIGSGDLAISFREHSHIPLINVRADADMDCAFHTVNLPANYRRTSLAESTELLIFSRHMDVVFIV